MGVSRLFRRPTKNPPKEGKNELSENVQKGTKMASINIRLDTQESQTTKPRGILKRRELSMSPLSASTQSAHGSDKYIRAGSASVNTRSTIKSHDSLAFQSIPLPDWESAIDEKSNRKYYYNTITHQSQWTEPDDYSEKWNRYSEAKNKYKKHHFEKNYTSEGFRKPGKSLRADKYSTPEDVREAATIIGDGENSVADATSPMSSSKTVRRLVDKSDTKETDNNTRSARSNKKGFGKFSSRKNIKQRGFDTRNYDENSQLPVSEETIFRKPNKLAFFTSSNTNPAHEGNHQPVVDEETQWDKKSVFKALEAHERHRQDFASSPHSLQDSRHGISLADSNTHTEDCSTQCSNSHYSEGETQIDEDETTYFTTDTDDNRTDFDSRDDTSYFTRETSTSSFRSSYDRDENHEEERDYRYSITKSTLDGNSSVASGLFSDASGPPPPPPLLSPTNREDVGAGKMLNTNGYDSNISHAKSFTSASTDYSVTVDTFASDEDGTVGTGTEAVLHARSFMTSNTMSQDDLENNSMMGDELLFRESTYRTCRADANVSGELTMKGLHGGH